MEPKFLKVETHEKGWGKEEWIVNNEKYCGKLLNFSGSSEFSMHFHIEKDETFYVLSGFFVLEWFDLETAERKRRNISYGDIIHIPPHVPHKLTSRESGTILEISTTHRDEDSYRVEKGDSQK